MFEVSVRSHFSAAHHLRGYCGKCETQHGHNWEVEVFVRGRKLDKTGILVDFRELKDAMANALSEVDHSDLNASEMFRKDNPTSENIAKFFFKELSAKLNCRTCKVHRVSVHETPGTTATYCETGNQNQHD